MQKRPLGRSGLEVSAIGFGCMGLEFGYGRPSSRQKAIAIIRAAVDARRHLLRHGGSVRAVHQRGGRRRGARAIREEVVIATKFGFEIENGTRTGLDSRPGDISRRCRCDLQAPEDRWHRSASISTAWIRTYRSRTWQGPVKELIREGKVKHFGLSEAGVADHPPRPRRPAGRGAAERVLAVVARPGSRGAADSARNSVSASCRSARSARAS